MVYCTMQGGSDLVCLNVGGKRFFVLRHNFYRYPATRLARLVRTTL